ncbi:MAG: membrane protein insertase YidC [Candidatus Kapabacteria bacterium]|nr:membrane protein insertase YidC [Ignavibacteriota bacterium]MCW5884997.1 membrane protein insertase YidC [Candidatus Kapabacteria bacterium]
MDKRTLIGYALIFVVVVGWMLWQQSESQEEAKKAQERKSLSDTTAVTNDRIPGTDSVDGEIKLEPLKPADVIAAEDTNKYVNLYGNKFAPFAEGEENIITIENDVMRARISSKGGAVKTWTLKKFKKWDGDPSQLIWNDAGEVYLTFTTFEGHRIDSRELYFDFKSDFGNKIEISGSDTAVFEMRLDVAPGKSIIRTYKFYGDKYAFDTDVIMEKMDDIIPPNRGYNIVWSDGVKYQEGSSVDESTEGYAVAQLNGSVAELNADQDEPVESKETGIIDYIGIKTKYFGAAIIPQPWQNFDGTADLYGWKKAVRDNGVVERYSISLRVPFNQSTDKKSFSIYIGPLDYDIVKPYGIQAMVNLGWKYGIRQISEYFMLPILTFIHKFVPNYGISIIIFSIIMKFLLYPLTIQQMKSAQKMQLLAPEMTKLREKYKDDNAKQQQAIMGLYSEYGINPVGGCLPMLLQMPILIALWQLLRASIDLRQAPFIWWIQDLSVPDKLIDFGFPILGLTHISGLALAMGITMFFQQKLTITDPRQKTLIYMMPVMFTLMFSYFPSGLNLYYFMFNLLSIGQQLYINKYSSNRPTLETLKQSPKKEGWLQKKMREAQQMAESQGKSIPGKYNTGGNYDNNIKKNKPQNKKGGKR